MDYHSLKSPAFQTLLVSAAGLFLLLGCIAHGVAADRSSATFLKGEKEFHVSIREALRDVSPSGILAGGKHDQEYSHEHRRSLLSNLRDISPPGLWPVGDDDDEHVNRRALLASNESDLHDTSPGIWPAGDITSPSVEQILAEALNPETPDSGELVPLGDRTNAAAKGRRRARVLLRDISPPGMWPSRDDDNDEYFPQRTLLSVDPSNPQSLGDADKQSDLHDTSPGIWPAGDNIASLSVEQILTEALDHETPNSGVPVPLEDRTNAEVHGRRRARALLRDISPPGMWPSGDDDNDEYFPKRTLLSVDPSNPQSLRDRGEGGDSHKSPFGRALHCETDPLRDISPPGMWPPQDDTPPSEARRLLATDSAPNAPVTWDGEVQARRARLRGVSRSSHSSPSRAIQPMPDHNVFPQRRFLSDLRTSEIFGVHVHGDKDDQYSQREAVQTLAGSSPMSEQETSAAQDETTPQLQATNDWTRRKSRDRALHDFAAHISSQAKHFAAQLVHYMWQFEMWRAHGPASFSRVNFQGQAQQLPAPTQLSYQKSPETDSDQSRPVHLIQPLILSSLFELLPSQSQHLRLPDILWDAGLVCLGA